MELMELAKCNLNFLLNLQEDDIVLSNRRNFYCQEEFVQVENIYDIEHTLYFTFNQILNFNHNYDINIKELFDDIDLAIENIYSNKYLNKLLEENKEFSTIMENIDELFENKRDRYLNRTICERLMDRFVIFSAMIGDFMRNSNLILMEYNGLTDLINNNDDLDENDLDENDLDDNDLDDDDLDDDDLDNDDDDDDDDDLDDDDLDDDNKNLKFSEKVNKETMEVNPNFIYSDDESDDNEKVKKN